MPPIAIDTAKISDRFAGKSNVLLAYEVVVVRAVLFNVRALRWNQILLPSRFIQLYLVTMNG